MPLIHGKSEKTISRNIAELIAAGHDPKQAAAIAYSVAKETDAASTEIVAPGQFLVESELSEHISETPEGYLLCEEVPVARIGELLYTKREVPEAPPRADGLVHVTRGPEDLFAPETLASFEGKPVTLGHPAERVVTPDNWAATSAGHIRNVRADFERGLLLADMLVTRRDAIDAVRTKRQREISLGYSADLMVDDEGAHQVNIRGNHCAIVERGRNGSGCAIIDAVTTEDYEMSEFLKKLLGRVEVTENLFGDAGVEELDNLIAQAEAAKLAKLEAQRIADEAAEPAVVADEDPMAVVAAKLLELSERIGEVNSRIDYLQSQEWMHEMREREKAELESALNVSEEQVEDACKPVMDEDTVARSEILAPGKGLDKADALKAAFGDEAIRPVIESHLHGVEFGDAVESPAAAAILFRAVSDAVSEQRKTKTARRLADAAATTGPAKIDLNQTFAAHYAGQK